MQTKHVFALLASLGIIANALPNPQDATTVVTATDGHHKPSGTFSLHGSLPSGFNASDHHHHHFSKGGDVSGGPHRSGQSGAPWPTGSVGGDGPVVGPPPVSTSAGAA